MANEKIILDKRSKKKDGTYPIKIYLRHNREILIATGYSCEESEFANGLLFRLTLNKTNDLNFMSKYFDIRSNDLIFAL